MTKALGAIGIGVGLQAVKQLGEMAFELAKDAAQAAATRESYNSLAASFGQNAEEMLGKMRAASKGMISDSALVLDANRAMLLGVASSGEKLGQLLEVARVRGQAMGISVGDAFDRLVLGLGRLSPKILDDLGIKGTQKALDDYAKSVGTTATQLSDAQQQAVLFNAVMASTQPLIDAAAGAGDNASEKFQQFDAKIANAKQRLGEFLLAAGATDTLDTFGKSIDASITQLETLDKWLATLKSDFDGFGQSTGLNELLDQFNGVIDRWHQVEGHAMFAIGLRPDDPEATKLTPAQSGGGGGFGTANPLSKAASSGTSGPEAVPASVFDPTEMIKAQVDYTKSLADITTKSNADILSATEDGARQRAEMIRSYDLGIVREEQDFARSRARQQRDYEQSIVTIMREAQARDAKIRADLDEQIGEARKASDKQLVKLDEDFAKARERALRDHRDNLLEAAGNLDAVAVEAEQRNFARQQKDASDAHDESRKAITDGLQERIDQERKASEEQLAAARDADAQRLEEMRASLEQRRADEDQDRQTRKDRAAEDQAHALDQQAEEQGRRIEQIVENAAAERIAQQEAFDAQLAALGLHNLAYEAEQKRAQDQAIKDLKPYMEDWYKTARDALEASLINPTGKKPGQTPAIVPAGFGFDSGGPLGAVAMPTSSSVSTSNSRTVNIHPGAVVVNATPGMDETKVAHEAIKGIALLLQETNH